MFQNHSGNFITHLLGLEFAKAVASSQPCLEDGNLASGDGASPSCARCAYEGNKVLVYLNTSAITALKWNIIDPHFSDKPKHNGYFTFNSKWPLTSTASVILKSLGSGVLLGAT